MAAQISSNRHFRLRVKRVRHTAQKKPENRAFFLHFGQPVSRATSRRIEADVHALFALMKLIG
jgi:hypothetical protein